MAPQNSSSSDKKVILVRDLGEYDLGSAGVLTETSAVSWRDDDELPPREFMYVGHDDEGRRLFVEVTLLPLDEWQQRKAEAKALNEARSKPAPPAPARTVGKWTPTSSLLRGRGVDINENDVKRLTGTKWLNDSLLEIGFLSAFDQAIQQNEVIASQTHLFNSFFVFNLENNDQAAVLRFTKKVDIFSKEYLIIPCNAGQAHWYLLIVICPAALLDQNTAKHTRAKILAFDSFEQDLGYSKRVAKLLQRWLKNEALRKREVTVVAPNLPFHTVKAPKQTDGWSCGYFSIYNFKQFLKDPERLVNQPREKAWCMPDVKQEQQDLSSMVRAVIV